MAYEKTTWVDNITELNAENMNHIEDGIEANSQDIETLNNNVLNKELTYSIIYKGAEAEIEFSYPFDFWKLNNDITSSNGIGIGYISEQQDNVRIVQVTKDFVSITAADSNNNAQIFVTPYNINIDADIIALSGNSLTFNGTDILPQVIENTSVSTWVSDNTYTGYDYRATITISGVTLYDIPEVIFGATEAISGNYLPIAETFNGGIYIYSKVNNTITIPTIIIQKRSVII